MNREKVLEAVYEKARELVRISPPAVDIVDCFVSVQVFPMHERKCVVIGLIQSNNIFKAFRGYVSDNMSVEVSSQSPFCKENDAINFWGKYFFEVTDQKKIKVFQDS